MDRIRILKKAGRGFDLLLNVLAVLAGVIVCFITVSVCVGIIARYIFNYPLGWVVEICEYSLLYVTFLVAAWVLRQNQHVSVDLFYSKFSPRGQSIASMATSIAAGIVFMIIVYYGVKVTKHQFDTKYFTPTILEAPKFAITLIIPIGTFLLLIQIIRKTYRHIQELTKGDSSSCPKEEGPLQIEP